MKVLITPFISHPRSDASYYIAQNIATTLTLAGHICAISSEKENRFHHASHYPCANKKPSLFQFKWESRTYEEWMKDHGALEESYLEEDLNCILNAISHFQPDMILTMNRISAVVAARLTKTPIDAIVTSSMYKTTTIPSSLLKSCNSFLRNHKLEQILCLKDLYQSCRHRFLFGPIELQPAPTNTTIHRLGCTSVFPYRKGLTNRVCIFLGDYHKSKTALRKVLTDAFLGAPYAVYVWYPTCKPEVIQNVHFMAFPREDMIAGSICMIHDGNDYYINQCLVRAIPQVIIASHEYGRSYNGRAIQRNMVGKYLYEEDLKMNTLYETFREVLSNDDYYDANQLLKKKTTAYGDLHQMIRLWEQ